MLFEPGQLWVPAFSAKRLCRIVQRNDSERWRTLCRNRMYLGKSVAVAEDPSSLRVVRNGQHDLSNVFVRFHDAVRFVDFGNGHHRVNVGLNGATGEAR